MDLIGAAPEMQGDGGDPRPIAGNFREVPIHIITHPDCEICVHDNESRGQGDKQPKPPTFCQRFHSLNVAKPFARVFKERAELSSRLYGQRLNALHSGLAAGKQMSATEREISMGQVKVMLSMWGTEKAMESHSA